MHHGPPQIEVSHPGREREPLAVVDNFFPFAEQLVAVAPRRPFHADSGFYPGHRSRAPGEYLAALRALLGGPLATVFGLVPDDIAGVDAAYSLVTLAPEQLSPQQRMPHFDIPRRNGIACVHYLFPEAAGFGGTSFYRHEGTGYEYVDAGRLPHYQRQLEADLARHGLPQPPRYIDGDTALFSRIARCPPRFNRALFYRACRLHSGDIHPDHECSADPTRGRLTMTAFIPLRDAGAPGPA